MKKAQSNKPQKDKKEKDKEKSKVEEKQLEKENKKNKKEQESDSEESFYTEEEIRLLDKFHEMTENNFVDDEIYDVMVKFKNDEELIENELKEMLKELKRGEEYGWTEIGKSK